MREQCIEYIRKKIEQSKVNKTKLRPIGKNFGIDLYDNILYKCNNVKNISLKDYEFDPHLSQSGNTLICHPNNDLEKCYYVLSEHNKMLLGTPLFYKISIGGCIMNGSIGSHILGTNLASYVKKLWIIDGNGHNCVIEGDELSYFRCSFGFLGIIYQIEIEIFDSQFFRINRKNSNIPFIYNNHICQLIINKNDEYYRNIIMEIVDIPKNKELFDEAQYKQVKREKNDKNVSFIFDGIRSVFSGRKSTKFCEIFFPENGIITNSYGLVKYFPDIPELVLQNINISLEVCVYVEEKNFYQVMNILTEYYKEWQNDNFKCIDIVIRKVLTNKCCSLDMTNGIEEFSPDVLIGIDFGFYGKEIHKQLIDIVISILLPLSYGFHLGKYVNLDILNFAKQKYSNKSDYMIFLKNKYDPEGIFSTQQLCYLYGVE